MKNGKISESILKRSVLKQIHGTSKDENIVLKSAVGNDSGVINFSAESMAVLGTSTISVDIKDIELMAQAAVFGAVNNVAASGSKVLAVSLNLVIPTLWNEADLRTLMNKLDKACEQAKVAIISGHTQVSRSVSNAIITVTVLGKTSTEMLADNKKLEPGMDIIATKWIGLEGTAILAKEKQEQLRERYSQPFLDKAAKMIDYLSIQSEAAVASKSDVCAMHDVSEGGIFGALWEMASSSGVGLDIDLKKIPIKQETVEICEYFNINPYKLISGGCLLLGVKDGNRVVRELEKEGINAIIIGITTDSNDRVLIQGEERRFLETAQSDEIYKVI